MKPALQPTPRGGNDRRRQVPVSVICTMRACDFCFLQWQRPLRTICPEFFCEFLCQWQRRPQLAKARRPQEVRCVDRPLRLVGVDKCRVVKPGPCLEVRNRDFILGYPKSTSTCSWILYNSFIRPASISVSTFFSIRFSIIGC